MKRTAIQELTVWFLIVALVLLIVGCTPRYKDRIVTVKQPVRVECALPRPAKVPALRDRFTDWDAMDVRQKAAAVGQHALDLRTYGEQLDAATGGC